jgi:uncharacterized protein YndB with AHSA1/START domain
MGDYSIKAAFEVDADPARVVEWLSTPTGIAGWWSDGVSGAASSVGDQFDVRFPTTDVVFQLVVAEATDNAVEWSVPASPPWWKGTAIHFDLEGNDSGGTSMLFAHRGFDPDDPIIAAITPAWVGFLNRLVEVAQTGRADPVVVN